MVTNLVGFTTVSNFIPYPLVAIVSTTQPYLFLLIACVVILVLVGLGTVFYALFLGSSKLFKPIIGELELLNQCCDYAEINQIMEDA